MEKSNTVEKTIADYAKYDPTHTTSLRNYFARDMKRRFKELMAVIIKAVDINDCFALKNPPMGAFQMTPPEKEAYAFMRDSEKIEAFMKWLEKQVENGIIQVGTLQQIGRAIETSWMNQYILDSYKRGVIRARMELKRAGVKVMSVEESGGIDAIMGLPMHLDRVGVLYTRVYNDLKGITAEMDTIISRILSQGMIDGDSPRLLAKKIVSTINGQGLGELGLTDKLGRFMPAERRAVILARTEIIRAHHLATIQEYRNFALEGVIVQAEWWTAGDDRVCDRCSSMEGKVYTLDEVEPMIPLHPQCRCIVLPWSEKLIKYVP